MGLFNVLFGRMIDRRISEYQNDLITKHYDEVQNIYKAMRGWRHDYHNHIQTMLALIGKDEPLKEYLLNLNDDLTTVDTVIKTGNVMIDAILNSKISLIQSKKISVNAKATVPPELKILEVDLCIILGNLLDNAMEACLAGVDNTVFPPWIRVYMGMLKGQLYISVSNSVKGEVRRVGKTYLSTKDSNTHGFGLTRIDRIVNKYNGYINRKNEEGVFATEIMLPL
ncbi:MAG TPA: ATP-binding protein [Clostridiales bacterium]|nr:ATP-binding protein [Clostridiales bacterium]